MDEAHLHVCLRYVELNPGHPGDGHVTVTALASVPRGLALAERSGHLGLARDGLADAAPMRARIDDWRSFLDLPR